MYVCFITEARLPPGPTMDPIGPREGGGGTVVLDDIVCVSVCMSVHVCVCECVCVCV